MSTNYLLADMLTQIRNGQKARLKEVQHKKSKVCEKILSILLKEGYISNYTSHSNKIITELKYKNNEPIIYHLSCISRPGKRVYAPIKTLWEVQKDLGIFILSTTKGIITDREAKQYNVGGEVLCLII